MSSKYRKVTSLPSLSMTWKWQPLQPNPKARHTTLVGQAVKMAMAMSSPPGRAGPSQLEQHGQVAVESVVCSHLGLTVACGSGGRICPQGSWQCQTSPFPPRPGGSSGSFSPASGEDTDLWTLGSEWHQATLALDLDACGPPHEVPLWGNVSLQSLGSYLC